MNEFWFFWTQVHHGWTCVGYVQAPHKAAEAIATWFSSPPPLVSTVGSVKTCASASTLAV